MRSKTTFPKSAACASIFLRQDRVAFERHDVLGDDGQAKSEFGGETCERLGSFHGACYACALLSKRRMSRQIRMAIVSGDSTLPRP